MQLQLKYWKNLRFSSCIPCTSKDSSDGLAALAFPTFTTSTFSLGASLDNPWDHWYWGLSWNHHWHWVPDGLQTAPGPYQFSLRCSWVFWLILCCYWLCLLGPQMGMVEWIWTFLEMCGSGTDIKIPWTSSRHRLWRKLWLEEGNFPSSTVICICETQPLESLTLWPSSGLCCGRYFNFFSLEDVLLLEEWTNAVGLLWAPERLHRLTDLIYLVG